MIDETSFYGLSIRTRTERRRVVIAYYLLLAFFLVVGMVKGHSIVSVLVPQTFILGAMLGGIQSGGPVKSYEEHQIFPLEMDGTVQTLGLGAPSRSPNQRRDQALDERERFERNQAHYRAYRILRWGLGLCAMVYWLAWVWYEPWLIRRTPGLLWVLLVVVLGLPQTVLLWTEPGQTEVGPD